MMRGANMENSDFLAAMRIVPFNADDTDPLAEALRIDDLRSEYCQRLELRIAEQQVEIETLRGIVQKGYRWRSKADRGERRD